MKLMAQSESNEKCTKNDWILNKLLLMQKANIYYIIGNFELYGTLAIFKRKISLPWVFRGQIATDS